MNSNSSKFLLPLALVAAGIISSVALSGCATGPSTTSPTPPSTPTEPTQPTTPTPPASVTVAFTGKAMAGSQPIAGSTVQVYAAGTAGNGSAPTALLSTELTTDATGAFSVPASYTCPSNSSQLYVVARGGKVGATTASNSAITLATVVGGCNQIAASTQLVVNEVTTAATIWGLSQFLATGANVGASSTNTQGLANAFATVANLANVTAGTAPGAAFPSNGASPAARINTLANLLNTCTAAVTDLSPCTNLLTAATPSTHQHLRRCSESGSQPRH